MQAAIGPIGRSSRSEDAAMHIDRNDIPVKIDVPGATARQLDDFGDAAGYGALSAEYFSLGAGTDIAPLLAGMPGDGCQAPHWGYLMEGEVVVSYTDGTTETCTGGQLFYWQPGHTVRVEADAEVILFSPTHEHTQALDHMADKLAAST
jgi:hypothetical protein